MSKNLRKSGIDILGDVPWGTHICQFYDTKEDLTDILVPYFKAGLENNEFCLWVTSQPLEVEDAKEAMRRAVPDLNFYLDNGQIEIIPYTDWFTTEGVFDSEKVLNGWREKLNYASDSSFDGVRLSGNTLWLEKEDWNNFVEYKKQTDNIIGNYRMIALCTYSLYRHNTAEIICLVLNHQFALVRREGKWEQIESSKRQKAEKTAIQATKNWEYTFDAVPDLIAVLDEEYQVVRANKAMAARLGVTPEECVGLTCYRVMHGTDEPPSYCPHRQLLTDGFECTTEIHEDRLGGDFIVSVSPLHDSEGNIAGCIHVARDITERKKMEEDLQHAYFRLRTLFDRKIDGIGIIIANVGGDILEANDYYLRILGSSREELEAGDVRWSEATPPEWLPLNEKAIAELREHNIFTPFEKEYIRRDGSRVPVLIAGSMFPGDHGEILAFVLDITKRKQEEHRRYRYSRILEGINWIFSNVVQAKTEEELGNAYLSVALEVTGGGIGFVGEVGADGLLHVIAISDVGWDQCLMHDKTRHRRPPGNFVLQGLYGNVVNSGKSFFTNDPLSHPDSIGLPQGHPPLTSFLGVPLVLDGNAIGVLVVANHEGGYSCEQLEDLEAIAPAVTQALQRKKAELERARTAEALREAYENLKVQSEELQAQSEEIQAQSEELQAQSEELQVQNEELSVQQDELNEANALLLENVTGFRTLAENSPDLIARFDRQNHCLYANPAVMEFHDTPQINPELVKLTEKQRDNAFTTGKPAAMEFHYVSPQGQEYYFDTKIVPEFIDGKVVSVLVISRDITDIKIVEAKLKETLDNLEELVEERTIELEKTYNSLKESEQGLAEAQRMAHIGNWKWNLVTDDKYWSDEVYRIFRLKPQEFEVTYCTFLSYVHPDDRDYVDNATKEALKGKPYRIDFRIVLADGEERIAHEEGEVVFDEKNIPIRMKGTIQDITEHKQEEHRIRRYNHILEGINRVFSNVMQAKTEEELGEACLSVALEVTGSEFGYIIEMRADGLLHDVAKSKLAWEQCHMYDKRGHLCLPHDYVVHGLYGSVIINGKSFFTNDPQSHPDSAGLPAGHPPIKSFLNVPFILDGKIVGSIGVGNREGGYSYEQQEDLEAIAPAVMQVLQRRKADENLRLKLEELARSNAELEQFAYVSSHDLQEPLRMISSYLQLLQRRYQGKIDDKADKYIFFAVDGAARMQVLINDLLEFSRVTTKAREPEPTNCEFVLNQMLSDLELFIRTNRATVSYDTLPEVMVDSTQLAQVFQNLIVNGIKFNTEEVPKIHISSLRIENGWQFSVQDNGIGIDPQYSEKIFEVFKRLHKKEEYPGTGIGLAICKKIMERHGGRIWVESELGGSTFYFTLPIDPEKQYKIEMHN